jgi:hypothetical protein
VVRLIAAATGLVLPAISIAHHSFAAHFLMNTFTEIEGRVTDIEWVNPHVKIYVEDAGGEIWEVEAGPVNLLTRMGIERDFVHVGETIRARGNPGRDDARALWIANILLSDNTELLVGPTAEPYWTSEAIGDASGFFEAGALGTNPERSFFRTWTPLIASMPRPQEEPTLTAVAQAAQSRYGIGNQVVGDCEVPGMPFAMMSPYPIELVDEGDRILIRGEAYDLERAAYTETPAREPAPSPLGLSLARIEDNVLIVETSRIDYHSYGDLGPAQSREAEVTERFTLSDDGRELAYELIVSDPVMLATPWRWGGAFVYREDETLKPWNCGVE